MKIIWMVRDKGEKRERENIEGPRRNMIMFLFLFLRNNGGPSKEEEQSRLLCLTVTE